jgi:hypothetical protein
MNGRLNDISEMIFKDTIIFVYFKTISQHMHGASEEIHERGQKGLSISRSRSELGTSPTQRNANDMTVTLGTIPHGSVRAWRLISTQFRRRC